MEIGVAEVERSFSSFSRVVTVGRKLVYIYR